ncbi:polyprenyl synthetase family protein [Chondromyces crocatus]|nr:polyprenyl synthetase family protein [Chondromyces crocatus]
MDSADRIERALRAAVAPLASPDAPPTLSAAVQHALFPGGGRIRPRLCLAVASACGDALPPLAEAAAIAVELVHCASLVHDDLPCFDDAPVRRGRPSVHAAFGEPLAVLAGDQLIALGFEVLAQAALVEGAWAPHHALGAARLALVLGRAVGAPYGIIGGQGWESEAHIPFAAYRRAKTGALFEAAAVSGAVASGQEGGAWRAFGQRIGEAYQLADDLLDVEGDAEAMGKPTGRDEALGRPNAAAHLGVHGARRLLRELLAEAHEVIPACVNAEALRGWLRELSEKLAVAHRPAVTMHVEAGSA